VQAETQVAHNELIAWLLRVAVYRPRRWNVLVLLVVSVELSWHTAVLVRR